jgi:ATP-binding cassette subfamily C protein
VIQSGSVAVFAVGLQEGVPSGFRRHLFNVSSGSLLFGMDPIANQQKSTLGFTTLEETELFHIATSDVNPFVEVADVEMLTLFERWVQQLGLSLSTMAISAIDFKIDKQTKLTLSPGQTVQPLAEVVTWVKIHRGKVRLLGLQETSLTSQQGFFPLSAEMWLQADDTAEITAQITSDICTLSVLLEGVSQIQTQVLHCIDFLEYQERTEALDQFLRRERLNHQITQQTIEDLTSALDQKTADFSESAPLLVATGAVGRRLGIPIHPPVQSTDLNRIRDPIEAISRASRIRIRQVLLEDDWWQRDSGPLLTYLQPDNRPIALLPAGRNGYEMLDSVTQFRSPLDADTAAKLSPIAYTFYRSLADKAISSLELLCFALRGLTKDISIVLLTGIAAALLGMLTPYATGILIDSAILSSDRGLVFQVGLGLLLSVFVSTFLQTAQGIALLRLEAQSDTATQPAVWDRLLNLKLSFFRQYSVGDLQSRVLSISEIRRLLSGSTLRTIFSSLLSLLNLVLLFYYSAGLASLALVAALIIVLVTTISGAILVRKVLPLEELSGKLFGTMVQLINGISKLRVAGAEERAFAYWSRKYSQQVRLSLSTQLVEDMVALFNTVMPTLTSAVLFWFATNLILESQTAGGTGLSTGTFLAFNAAFAMFVAGARSLNTTIVTALRIVPLQKRAQPILDTCPEVDVSKADPGRLIGRISIDHVSFRYREDAPLVLQNVSIHAEPSEFIAIVGPSGSGKSTLFQVLLGFDMPQTGHVYLID